MRSWTVRSASWWVSRLSLVVAVLRLVRAPRRIRSPEAQAMQAALHAATATLPALRRGLDRESARRAVPHPC